jgi:hypothetical protein
LNGFSAIAPAPAMLVLIKFLLVFMISILFS